MQAARRPQRALSWVQSRSTPRIIGSSRQTLLPIAFCPSLLAVCAFRRMELVISAWQCVRINDKLSGCIIAVAIPFFARHYCMRIRVPLFLAHTGLAGDWDVRDSKYLREGELPSYIQYTLFCMMQQLQLYMMKGWELEICLPNLRHTNYYFNLHSKKYAVVVTT